MATLNPGYQINTATTDQQVTDFLKFFESTFAQDFTYYTANSIRFILQVDYRPEFIRESISTKRWVLLLATQDSRIIGYLLYNRSYAGISMANWLAVHEDYRKHGIATHLIDSWHQQSLDQGAHKLLLWTTPNNQNFYQNRGFTKVGEVPDSYFGIDNIILYKTLRQSDEPNYLKRFFQAQTPLE